MLPGLLYYDDKENDDNFWRSRKDEVRWTQRRHCSFLTLPVFYLHQFDLIEPVRRDTTVSQRAQTAKKSTLTIHSTTNR